MESTRNCSIERIFLTFGKLGKPVRFISRPYEECLSGIAVTHYPRYKIDMRLKKGETIFDKMEVPYEVLRLLDNPVAPVSNYYKNKLKPGESLWWVTNDFDTATSPTVRLWSTLSQHEKDKLTVQGYALFPEVLTKNNQKKYNRFALWLVTQEGIVNTNLRDRFSAGGKVALENSEGFAFRMPAAFGRIKKYHKLIASMLWNTNEDILEEYWEEKVEPDRLRQWCRLAAHASSSDPEIEYSLAMTLLSEIFSEEINYSEAPKKFRQSVTLFDTPGPHDKVAEISKEYKADVTTHSISKLES